MKKVFVRQKVLKSIYNGHPWVFSGAIESVGKDVEDGDVCGVFFEDDHLGTGYFNSQSDICLRIVSRWDKKLNSKFFVKRFDGLKRSKEEFISDDTDCYRVVFGESDNLPGLVVDKYADVLSVQFHTLGMDKLRNEIVDALVKVFNPSCIYERSDIGVRKKEGLVPQKGLLYGEEQEWVEIKENGMKFLVNVIEGQKTGFFLDQRENREALAKYCNGKKVLNCFSYTGGFSVYAAKTAEKVVSVDISKPATENAIKNFELNGFDTNKHEFIAKDVFDYLKAMERGSFDVIILDPPSFAKNKKQLKNAIKAYTTINSKAIEKLNDGGILVSASCTAHIDEMTFIKILHQSSVNAKCQLKLIKSFSQPHDHGYNLCFPEGRYLKFFILQKTPIY